MTNLPEPSEAVVAFTGAWVGVDPVTADMDTAARVVRIAVLIDTYGDEAREAGEKMAALVHDEKRWMASHQSWASWWSDVTGASPRTSYRWVARGRGLLGLPAIGYDDDDREPAGQSVPPGTGSSSHVVSNGRTGGSVALVEAPDPPPLPNLPDPPPLRPDTPGLNAVLDSMRAVGADVAGAVADDDQYREIVRWCRAFQDTYQLMHPRRQAPTEVEPRFKKEAKR